MVPYIGDASGNHDVPEPFRLMGRFNEKALFMEV
jgi:hypothetical protein